jgi:uncharacterized protein (DUF952 family)
MQQYDATQLAFLQQQQLLLQANPAALQALGTDYKFEVGQHGQLFMHAY